MMRSRRSKERNELAKIDALTPVWMRSRECSDDRPLILGNVKHPVRVLKIAKGGSSGASTKKNACSTDLEEVVLGTDGLATAATGSKTSARGTRSASCENKN